MDFEDLLQPEVAVGAAIAAAIFSPRIRGLLRQGVVYTLAGGLIAGDAVTSVAKGVGQGAQKAASSASSAASNATSGKPTARRVPVATDGAQDTTTATEDNTVDGTILDDTETTAPEDAGRQM